MALEIATAAIGSRNQYSFLDLLGYNEDGSCLMVTKDSHDHYTSSGKGEFSFRLPRIEVVTASVIGTPHDD